MDRFDEEQCAMTIRCFSLHMIWFTTTGEQLRSRLRLQGTPRSIYSKLRTGEWKFYFQTSALNYTNSAD